MIKLVGDWREIEEELNRVSKMPTPKTRQLLGEVLSAGFQATQEAVHVQTGALKSSGKKSSNFSRLTKDWEGEISYGAEPSSVDYAIYEKRRGVHWAGPSSVKGDHDFMHPLDTFGSLWVEALLGGLRRD